MCCVVSSTSLRLSTATSDDVIDRLAHQFPYDQLKLQRLKKRKLVLKI